MKLLNDSETRQAIFHQESDYALEWLQDAEKMEKLQLYTAVTELVDPKDNEVIADIGTGMAKQLLSLVCENPRSILIGTERTRGNTIAAYEYVKTLGVGDAFTVFSDSELAVTDDRRLFWQRGSKLFRLQRGRIRELLKEKILLLDDNILYPTLLPEVLPNGRIDAGILSMPGGSSSRLYEWPLRAREVDKDNQGQRVMEATDATRRAFYRFMSEYVHEDGRIVVAERMMREEWLPDELAGPGLVIQHMGEFHKYWTPGKGAKITSEFGETAVGLKAIDHNGVGHDFRQKERYEASLIIMRFDRNKVPFKEPPAERP